MANFKTHISLGALLGIVFVVGGFFFSLIQGGEVFFWIFGAVLVGSFLPDIDLDKGIPFQIVFGLVSATLAAVVFFALYHSGERDLKILAGVPLLVFGITRFVAGGIFMRFTRHRGMLHSVPAAVLAGMATFLLLDLFSIKIETRIFAALAVSAGYVGHLVLDEIYSTVNFQGLAFRPKKSLGSALKFVSQSKTATFLAYGLIVLLYLYL